MQTVGKPPKTGQVREQNLNILKSFFSILTFYGQLSFFLFLFDMFVPARAGTDRDLSQTVPALFHDATPDRRFHSPSLLCVRSV